MDPLHSLYNCWDSQSHLPIPSSFDFPHTYHVHTYVCFHSYAHYICPYMYIFLSFSFSPVSTSFSLLALVYSHSPIRQASLVPVQIHFRQSYRRPLPRTILYGRYLRLLLLCGDGCRYCMAAAHRETILTAKKTSGTLRYESCNLSPFSLEVIYNSAKLHCCK